MRGSLLLLSFLCVLTPVLADATINRLLVTSSVSPSSIYSGDTGFINLVLTNQGPSSAYDVQIAVTGFSPELSIPDGSFNYSVIDASSQQSISFLFSVNESSSKGIYFVDFDVTYTSGTRKTERTRVFIEVLDVVNMYYVINSNELKTGSNNVSITLVNPNSKSIGNIFVKLIGSSPFSIKDSERHIPIIEPFSNATISYEVYVNDVPEGIYSMVLSKEYFGVVSNSSLNFWVHGKPDLTYEVVGSYNLRSGQSSNITFSIRNTGLVPAHNVKVKLSANDPFSIINPEAFIPIIESNSSSLASFNYAIAYDAKPGIYPLTLDLDYESSSSDEFNVKISGLPKLEIAKINTDPEKVYSNSEISLSVQLENTGAGKAKNVKAFIDIASDKINGVNEFFIGSINNDDIDSAVFDLILGSVPEGPLSFNLTVTYSDQDDNNYLLNQSFKIYVRTLQDYSIIGYIIAGVAIVLIFVFRNRIKQYFHKLSRMI